MGRGKEREKTRFDWNTYEDDDSDDDGHDDDNDDDADRDDDDNDDDDRGEKGEKKRASPYEQMHSGHERKAWNILQQIILSCLAKFMHTLCSNE